MNMRSLEILLVEDDPVFAELAKTTLEGNDGDCAIAVHVATDGEEALQFLRKQGKYSESVRPDVILLDINLPKVDGFEVLADVKADDQLRRIPVVILTVSADEHDVLKAYDSGANTYFNKPGVNDDFAELANTIKKYWRAASPPPGPEFEVVGRPKSITKERQGDTIILTLTTNLGEFEAIELQVSEVVEQVLQDPEIKNLLVDFHKTNSFRFDGHRLFCETLETHVGA